MRSDARNLPRPSASAARLSGCLALLILAGCGGAGPQARPAADVARTSLEKALSSWKDGGRPGEVPGSDPPVQVVDSAWQSGRKLGSFEILRAEAADQDQRFTVRLNLLDPAADQETLYVVLGQGPVWVYREEDYRRMINMEDNPTPAKEKRRRR